MRRDVPTYDPRTPGAGSGSLAVHVIYLLIVVCCVGFSALVINDKQKLESELVEDISLLEAEISTLRNANPTRGEVSAPIELEVFEDRLGAQLERNEIIADELRTLQSVESELRSEVMSLRSEVASREGVISQLRRQIRDLDQSLDTKKRRNTELELLARESTESNSPRADDLTDNDSAGSRVSSKTEAIQPSFDQDYLPTKKVGPVYPLRAQIRGTEGFCVLTYTVTAEGTIKDPYVAAAEDCPDSIFLSASIRALSQFKYRPRTVNGRPVAVSGVQNKFTYELE